MRDRGEAQDEIRALRRDLSICRWAFGLILIVNALNIAVQLMRIWMTS